MKRQWTIAASFLTPLVSSSPASSIFIHHHLSIRGRRLMSLNMAGSAGLAHAEKMGSANFDPHLDTVHHPKSKHIHTITNEIRRCRPRFSAPESPRFFFFDAHSINPRILLAKHPIFSPAVEHSGRCHTDTSIVFKVVWFNGESCTIAPLT